MTTVGIDLGTSRVRAAVVSGRTPQVLQFGDGAHYLPAAVAVENGAKHVGRSAVARAAMNPQSSVLGVKRFLGRPASDEVVQQIAQRSGLVLAAREDGGIGFRMGGETVTPEELAGELMAHVSDTIAKTLGEAPGGALLTTPYWYGPRQRQALKESAERAGLRVLQVMSDGTAIALSLAAAELEQRRVAIVDIGAGGCSVSILEMGPERVVLLANAGARDGGGDDIDHDIVRALLKGLRDKYGDFPVMPAIREMIRQSCGDLKRDLLAVETAQATIPFLPIGAGVSMQQVTLQRRHLQVLIAPTLGRVRASCAQALQAASLGPEALDAVYVTGGLSQMPLLREAIASVMGKVTSRQLDVDGAVAIGASLQSAMMDGRLDPIPTIDIVTSPSIAPPSSVSRATIPPAEVRSIRPPGRPSQAPPFVGVRSSVPSPAGAKGTLPPPPPPPARPESSIPPAGAGARRSPGSSPARPHSSRPSAYPPGAAGVRGGSNPPPPHDGVQISYREAVADVPVATLRVELASLLASVRGGALTEGARAGGNVVRTSPEAVEADDAPAEARQGIAERLTDICAQLHRAMQAARQYGWEHPHTTGYFDRVHHLLQQLHAEYPRSARLELGTTSFTYDRTVVWRPERAPFDTIPYQLFIDGLRVLQLKAGIERWEVQALAAVMLRDIGGGLTSEDDAVTALWDRRLPHVGYGAIDAYLDTDDPNFERELEALERDVGDLCDFDDVDGMSARLDAQRAEADEAVGVTIPKEVREQMAAGAAMSEEAWLGAYAVLFPSVLREGDAEGDGGLILDGLETLARQWIGTGQSALLLSMLEKLTDAVQASSGQRRANQFCREASAAMFPPERLTEVVGDLVRTAATVQTIHQLSRVLDSLPDDRFFDGAGEGFWEAPEVLQQVLLRYQLRFAQGRESAFGEMLARGTPRLAMAALRGLAALGTEDARSVLVRAFDSTHLEVKVSAIGFLPEAATETVRSEVTRLLEDPSDALRLSTLHVLSGLGSTAVGPVLVRRIQSVDLATVAVQERRLLLDTLVRLSPRRGSEIAIEILDTTQMIPTQGPEETRAIAAEVLASVDSPTVVEALERAARKRWSNSNRVREAAIRSLEAIRARRATGSEVPQ